MNIPALTLIPATANKIPNNVSRSSIEYKMWWDSPSSDTDWCNHPSTHHKLARPRLKILRWCHLKKNQP